MLLELSYFEVDEYLVKENQFEKKPAPKMQANESDMMSCLSMSKTMMCAPLKRSAVLVGIGGTFNVT